MSKHRSQESIKKKGDLISGRQFRTAKIAFLFFLLMSFLEGCSTVASNRNGYTVIEEKQFIDLDNVRIAYEDYGSGSPIVFVHGFGASSYSWRAIAKGLAETRRTICLDLMGFGLSDKPHDESYTLTRQADLLSQFIQALDLRSVTLIGHSYGGGVCLTLLSQTDMLTSSEVERLVLVDTVCYKQKFPAFISCLRTPVLNRFLGLVMSPRTRVKMILELAYHDPSKILTRTVDEYAYPLTLDGAEAALISTAKNIIPGDLQSLTASYSRIQIPTFLLWGERDRITPLSLGKKLAESIPNSEIEVFVSCGHVPQEEKPEETLHFILHVLDSQGTLTEETR